MRLTTLILTARTTGHRMETGIVTILRSTSASDTTPYIGIKKAETRTAALLQTSGTTTTSFGRTGFCDVLKIALTVSISRNANES
jgi:hypothetical protein